ncbi:MAG TPA: hypothetical protein VHG28_19390 [Longimicrobiaceae bacterium]|nr:hypothetical protein [Longimicrobiaceae bacterium]
MDHNDRSHSENPDRSGMHGMSESGMRRDSGTPDRGARESLGGSRTISDRERSPEDGLHGVAEERGRMGGYGYDTPADVQQASDAERPERDDGSSGGR